MWSERECFATPRFCRIVSTLGFLECRSDKFVPTLVEFIPWLSSFLGLVHSRVEFVLWLSWCLVEFVRHFMQSDAFNSKLLRLMMMVLFFHIFLVKIFHAVE